MCLSDHSSWDISFEIFKIEREKKNQISALTLTSFGDFISDPQASVTKHIHTRREKNQIIQRQRTIHIHISTEDIIYTYYDDVIL